VSGVALLSREEAGGPRGQWTVLAAHGSDPCLRSEDADSEVPVGDGLVLVLRGRTLAAEDQRMLAAFATEVAVAYRQRQLAEAAGAARELAETDRARTALLNAVSHDLRTPIASAKAAVSGLRSAEIDWTDADRNELLATADLALDRLTALVTNLLDLSRLQAGALSVELQPVGVDDLVNRALSATADAGAVKVNVSPDLPEVLADAGLAERVIANVVENALRYTPAGAAVVVVAELHGDRVELRVIDRGPGIAPGAKAAVFEAFQRRDDRSVSTGAGVGLGLAIARGFVESMHGSISLDDTPGGGLIVNISLPVAARQ
jgi:two-component system sensor histidine kinase KdpD